MSDEIPLDAVINLAGASIADGRWTAKRKDIIWDSRIRTTRLLSQAIATLEKRPEVMLSASAIGYYGSNRPSSTDEFGEPADDFLARLSVAWESAADKASEAGIRVVKLRFGLVLDSHGGVLDKLVLPMGLAVVGRLGDGRHLQPWITLQDAIKIILGCISNRNFAGAVNLVAPEVVSNKDFAKTLGEVLRRPRLPAMPATIVRLMFGEMADAALLATSNICSSRLDELGVELQYKTLRSALENIYRK